MAQAPSFASTPRVGVGSVTVANTNRDGTGTLVDIITGVAAGTKIFEVVVKSAGDLADSVVTLFYYDGSTNWLLDEIDVGDPAAGSTTVTSYRFSTTYNNLVLPNASCKLRAAVTVAPTAGAINVFAFAGDMT
jgi:hypothetical protein